MPMRPACTRSVSCLLVASLTLAGCQNLVTPDTRSATLTQAKADFMAGEWKDAALGCEAAMAQSTTDPDRAACALLAAQSWNCCQEHLRAARLTDQAAIWCPTNKQVAAARWSRWKVVADTSGTEAAVGLQSARDHMLRLEPGMRGEPVCDPITGAVIITALIVAAVTIWIHEVPPQERAGVVMKALDMVPNLSARLLHPLGL